jgi:hypothetical protein
VTNFTPSLPLDRRGQGSQSTEFENRWVTSMWYSVEIDLGGQAKAAIRGHLKTGHREKP